MRLAKVVEKKVAMTEEKVASIKMLVCGLKNEHQKRNEHSNRQKAMLMPQLKRSFA